MCPEKAQLLLDQHQAYAPHVNAAKNEYAHAEYVSMMNWPLQEVALFPFRQENIQLNVITLKYFLINYLFSFNQFTKRSCLMSALQKKKLCLSPVSRSFTRKYYIKFFSKNHNKIFYLAPSSRRNIRSCQATQQSRDERGRFRG